MTPEHALYIPTIFLLGFLAGALVTERRRAEALPGNATQGRQLLLTFLFFAGIFVVTHFFQVPYGAHAVAEALGGVPIFDKQPCFSSEEVYQRLDTCHTEGLATYQRFTYTVDVLFPAALLWFLLTLARFVADRRQLSAQARKLLRWIPLAWFVADMLENGAIFYLLYHYPAQVGVAAWLGYLTIGKFVLLVLSVAGPVCALLRKK